MYDRRRAVCPCECSEVCTRHSLLWSLVADLSSLSSYLVWCDNIWASQCSWAVVLVQMICLFVTSSNMYSSCLPEILSNSCHWCYMDIESLSVSATRWFNLLGFITDTSHALHYSNELPFVLIISTFVFNLSSIFNSLWLDVTHCQCVPRHCHFSRPCFSPFRPQCLCLCTRMAQISVCQIYGGTVFLEKNVVRSRLHDDAVGNENI